MHHVKSLTTLALLGATLASANAAPLSPSAAPQTGIIEKLYTIATIGSAIDPVNGDRNPYGLAIAPVSAGIIKAGDLITCNFNDLLNIQGLGSSIDVLSPVVGSKPRHLIADPRLTGCAAVALGAANPWVAALDANDNPIVSPAGALLDPINNFAWTGPWGQAFVAGPASPPAFYATNANDGSVVRINLAATFTFDKIVSGAPVNHGVPGNILAPSGLTYDAQRDVLYLVDGAVNAVVALKHPATIHNGGILFTKDGKVYGPQAWRMKILHVGAPLNAPISTTLLFNGDLVISNSADNRLIEMTPAGRIVGSHVLDNGAPGALFGIVASGTSAQTTRIYFNDDNDNTVKVLAP